MLKKNKFHAQSERGITILLVAIAMTAILAMAALAIDIVALYVARGEAQRAADAGALAGAQMLVAAGVTGDPGDKSGIWSVAETVATKEATVVAQQNPIGGSTPTVTVSFPNDSLASFGINPQVSVSVTRSSPPVFFGRIWGGKGAAASISASATAEAFNPSNSASVGSKLSVPVAPQCVKPWVIPNCDPNPKHTSTVANLCTGTANATLIDVDPVSGKSLGTISNPGPVSGGIIGEYFTLTDNCNKPQLSGCNPITGGDAHMQVGVTSDIKPIFPALYGVEYVVPQYSPATNPPDSGLSSCGSSSHTIYQKNIEACNPSPFSCVGTPNGNLDFNNYSRKNTLDGLTCLTHSPGADTLDTSGFSASPMLIRAGSANPLQGQVATGDVVTTSNSIITLAIFDGTTITSTPINIIGFLQAFIDPSSINGGGSVMAAGLTSPC